MKKIIHIGLQQLTQKVIENKLNQIYIYIYNYYYYIFFSESDLFFAVNAHLNMLA